MDTQDKPEKGCKDRNFDWTFFTYFGKGPKDKLLFNNTNRNMRVYFQNKNKEKVRRGCIGLWKSIKVKVWM
jgi:hypothetical protein